MEIGIKGKVETVVDGSNTAKFVGSLERALNRSITQCYALEGTYPPNLKYLTDHRLAQIDTD